MDKMTSTRTSLERKKRSTIRMMNDEASKDVDNEEPARMNSIADLLEKFHQEEPGDMRSIISYHPVLGSSSISSSFNSTASPTTSSTASSDTASSVSSSSHDSSKHDQVNNKV